MKFAGCRTIFLLFISIFSLVAQEPDPILAKFESGNIVQLNQLPFVDQLPMPEEIRSFVQSLTVVKPDIKKEGDMIIVESGTIYKDIPIAISIHYKDSKWSLLLGLPAGFRFSAISNRLASLDQFSLSRALFIFNQHEKYTDTTWNIEVFPGVTLQMSMAITGELEKFFNLVPAMQKQQEITLQGNLTPQIVGSSFKLALPGSLRLGSIGETTAITFALYFKPLAAGIAAGPFDVVAALQLGMNILLPGQKNKVSFLGEIQVSGIKLILNAWMVGFWENAFGIRGFGLGDLGFAVGQNYAIAASSAGFLPITEMCLQGGVSFGSKIVKLTGCIDLSPAEPEWILTGDFQGGLYLQDIVDFGATIITRAAGIVGKKVDLVNQVEAKMPRIGFKQAKIYIVPSATIIMGKTYAQGIDVGATADILGKDVMLAVAFNDQRFFGSGFIQSFNIGPLSVTGQGTKGDVQGAQISFLVEPKSQKLAEFFIDGQIDLDLKDLGLISGKTKVNLTMTGISIEVGLNIFNEFQASCKVNGMGAISPAAQAKLLADAQKMAADPRASAEQKEKAQKFIAAQKIGGLKDETSWGIEALFKQDALANLSEKIKKASEQLIIDAKANLGEKQKEVKSLDNQVAQYDLQIASLQKEIDTQQRTNRANVEKAIAQVQKAQEQLSSLDQLKKQLDEQVSRCTGSESATAKEVKALSETASASQKEIDAATQEYLNAMDFPPDVANRIKNQMKKPRSTPIIPNVAGPLQRAP